VLNEPPQAVVGLLIPTSWNPWPSSTESLIVTRAPGIGCDSTVPFTVMVEIPFFTETDVAVTRNPPSKRPKSILGSIPKFSACPGPANITSRL